MVQLPRGLFGIVYQREKTVQNFKNGEMKTRSVRSKEGRIPTAIPCAKVNGIRKIDKEARDKRIGLSKEQIKEMENSSLSFFQLMLKNYGVTFWFHWQEGGTDPEGFRFTSYWVEKCMWFLFINGLEERLQDIVDKMWKEKANEPRRRRRFPRKWIVKGKDESRMIDPE